MELELTKIRKRNGDLVDYSFDKVEESVKKTFICTYGEIPKYVQFKHLKNSLGNYLNSFDDTDRTVEKVQDYIEKWLMEHDYYDAAKKYILYREEHKNIRFITDRIDYIQRYVDSTANAASSSETDDNANVLLKNVANLNGEVYKNINRHVQRRRMKQQLASMYDIELGNQYLIDLEDKIFYTHDESSFPVIMPYCSAYSLYSLLIEGVGNLDGVTPGPPKNLDSFCGQFINSVFLLASQVKGAVAFGGLFVAFNWYCVREWGKDYYKLKEKNIFTSINNTQRTVEEQIVQYFQQIIWGVNQPAGNRSSQSPFTNVSYYDKNYYNAMFEGFAYPDTTKPEWEQIDYLQRLFMRTLNKERLTSVVAFPVETMCLLSNGKDDILDTEYKNFTAQMYAEGHSFFTYISDSPNAIASCCFDGDEVITVKNGEEISYMTISDFVNSKTKEINKFGKKIDENITIKAYNTAGEVSDEKIVGVLKKEYNGKMYTFDTDSGSITVTADHPMMVQDENENILELAAEEVAKNINKYRLATE